MSISFILSNYNPHFAHIFRQQFGENADYPPFLKRASRADCQRWRRGYTPSISREHCKGFAGKQCVDAEALHRKPDKSIGQVQADSRIHGKPAQLSLFGAKRQAHKSRCGGKDFAAPPHIKGEFPEKAQKNPPASGAAAQTGAASGGDPSNGVPAGSRIASVCNRRSVHRQREGRRKNSAAPYPAAGAVYCTQSGSAKAFLYNSLYLE